LEDKLHGLVAFGIMPLFALANAGVRIVEGSLSVLTSPIVLGIIFGLVLGKPIGITAFSWLSARSGVAALSSDVGWGSLHGVSWLGGIGFTMSLFIANLAFGGTPLLEEAKVGILVPATNTIVEPELAAMQPPGVTNHVSRMGRVKRNMVDLDQYRSVLGSSLDMDQAIENALDGLGEALWWLGDPAASLAASERARVRVVISDGFNTAVADSEPLVIEAADPRVFVDRPSDGSLFVGQQLVSLHAEAWSAGEQLDDGQVEWRSDLDGVIGHGLWVAVRADELSEGEHTISVTATGPTGRTASDSITIEIRR
jgi:hypothetical protein